MYSREELAGEVWKIARYDGEVFALYAVSSLGRLRSLRDGRLLRFGWCKSRFDEMRGVDAGVYWRAGLYRHDGTRKMISVHILTAQNFVGGRTALKRYVHHRNGKKHDPRSTNLEWTTQSHNIREYYAWKRAQGSLALHPYEPVPIEDAPDDYGWTEPQDEPVDDSAPF